MAEFIERAKELGLDPDVREMSETTHTAADAAAAVGTSVESIVKSLLFLAGSEPLLVLVSGPNRVDAGLLSEVVGVPVAMADAKSVKALTGYSIGGVPPLGHPTALRTVIDIDLLTLELVWAAAGSARAVFAVEPRRLAEITGAIVARVA